MAVSLETRAPFLDHELIEFAWILPPALKIRNGKTKWLTRRLLEAYLPPTLIDRPKMGFGIPLDAWLRGPLRDWGEALLAEDRLNREGYFNTSEIRKVWKLHQSRQGSYGHRLWSVLMFQAWLESHHGA
jgi:asparagine synthase (glutamine-hydrolysing)